MLEAPLEVFREPIAVAGDDTTSVLELGTSSNEVCHVVEEAILRIGTQTQRGWRRHRDSRRRAKAKRLGNDSKAPLLAAFSIMRIDAAPLVYTSRLRREPLVKVSWACARAPEKVSLTGGHAELNE